MNDVACSDHELIEKSVMLYASLSNPRSWSSPRRKPPTLVPNDSDAPARLSLLASILAEDRELPLIIRRQMKARSRRLNAADVLHKDSRPFYQEDEASRNLRERVSNSFLAIMIQSATLASRGREAG